jgi:hypothetical protein
MPNSPQTSRPPIKVNPLANTKVPLPQAIQMLHVPGNPSPQEARLMAAVMPRTDLSR